MPTCSDAELVWIDEDRLAAAGAQPWTQLPCWVPQEGEFAGFLEADTAKAGKQGCGAGPSKTPCAIPGSGCSGKLCRLSGRIVRCTAFHPRSKRNYSPPDSETGLAPVRIRTGPDS